MLEDRTLLSRYFTVEPAVNITRATGNQSEATIVVDPTDPNRLFAASNPGMFARYSTDGGKTWRPSNLAGVPASCCDNQAAADPFGNLFVVYLGPNFSTLVAYSTNFGASFAGVLTAIPGSTDQPSIGVGGSVNPGEYTVWASADLGQNGIRAAGARVTGLGQISPFSAPQLAPGSFIPPKTHGSFGGTSVGPNGEVMVTYQRPIPGPGPSEIYVNTDPDGLGPAGFGPAVLVSPVNVGGFAPITPQPNRTIDAEANLAWDRSGGVFTGRAYLVYTDRPSLQSNDTDIYVRYSDDNGATWTGRIKVNDDTTTNSQFNPAIAVDQTNGQVAVSWYDARNVPANNAAEVWASASLDGGNSWLENVKISPGVTNCITGGQGFDCGDYDTMDFDAGYFYRVWADNSPELPGNPDRPRQDLATARVRVGNPKGPFIVAQTPRMTVEPPVGSVRVTFNTAIDPKTFTTKDVAFSGPLGKIPVAAVVPVKGSGDTQFDILFDAQGGTGQYALVIGPDILDAASGMPMDQDFDGKPGEPEDIYRARFNLSGLRVTAHTPAGAQGEPVGGVRLTFSRPLNPATFTPADVTFTAPGGGAIKIAAVTPVKGSEDRQFDVTFAAQGGIGTYTMVVGPDVRDLFANPMDQNGNLIPGEPGDRYTATFTLLGPRVTLHTPRGGAFDPVSVVRVSFNRPMDPKTLTPDDVVSFTGPGGPIPVLAVTPVKGSEDREFEFFFEEQSLPGNYALVFGPDVLDLFANPMDQNNNLTPGEVPGDRYTAAFQIADVCVGYSEPFGYLACVSDFLDYSIVGQPGTFTVLGTGTDLAAAVNLGTNRFSFYGTTYTGNNQLFVSNKGLITFGSATTFFTNTDLSVLPQQRAIAVLWDDWVKPSGGPSVLGQFLDFDLDGVADVLILEWNQVQHYPSTPSGVSFQAVLFLNTGGPGAVYLNYLDLDSGSLVFDDGNSATVGIKDAGTQGSRRILLAFNSIGSPYLGSGKALLVGNAFSGPGAPSPGDGLDGGTLDQLRPAPALASPIAPSRERDWVFRLEAESDSETLTSPERERRAGPSLALRASVESASEPLAADRDFTPALLFSFPYLGGYFS